MVNEQINNIGKITFQSMGESVEEIASFKNTPKYRKHVHFWPKYDFPLVHNIYHHRQFIGHFNNKTTAIRGRKQLGTGVTQFILLAITFIRGLFIDSIKL